MRVYWNKISENFYKSLFCRLSYVFPIFIQSYIKSCFCFTYILFITQNALYQIYNITAGIIDVAEYPLFLGLLTLKSSCFFYFYATLWHIYFSGMQIICLVLAVLFVFLWLYSFQFFYFLLSPWGFHFA